MPPLARLSFFIPPAQFGEFAHLYDRQLLPLLRPHGLKSGQSDDRPYVAGVFSRLFAVESPTTLTHIQQSLRLDPAWQRALKALEGRLGTSLRHELSLYATSEPGGKGVRVGNGQRQGPWHTLSVADGLGSPLIGALLWDRAGKLWLGTWEGLSCFDGVEDRGAEGGGEADRVGAFDPEEPDAEAGDQEGVRVRGFSNVVFRRKQLSRFIPLRHSRSTPQGEKPCTGW